MTILGLGNDIIEIERVRQGFEAHGEPFLARLFTPKEIAYCRQQKNPYPRFAGRFAAKEAIAKALGTGVGADAKWVEIEILADERGKPLVHLSDTLKKRLNGATMHVTISHCQSYAAAVAILAT